MYTPGLGVIRKALERQPRDPFAVGQERAADALGIRWGDSYHIKARKGGFEAVRRHGPRISLTAATPDDLERAMIEDSGSW